MIFIEMSRDEAHGGGSWAFGACVWAPSQKRSGGRWPFWQKILDIREGDIILHLRGIGADAAFIGYSEAATDGFLTADRPPEPGLWGYSQTFCRADLENFTPLDSPVSLRSIFSSRRAALEECFQLNAAKGPNKAHLFYVKQSGRLQCLNGAYLSELNSNLFSALFGEELDIPSAIESPASLVVKTGSKLTNIWARLGQSDFSQSVKRLYKNVCCFPGCEIADGRFLVASHITRWSDNVLLRGQIANGLCLCLMHDKAFEVGLYTLDDRFSVFVNLNGASPATCLGRDISKYHGVQIKLGAVHPLREALREHWARFGLDKLPELSREKP